MAYNNTNPLSLQFWRPKVWIGFTGLEKPCVGVWRTCSSWRHLRMFPCLFWLLEAVCILWITTPLLYLQASSGASSKPFLLVLLLPLSHHLLSHSYTSYVPLIRTLVIISDLPRLPSITSRFLITSAKSLCQSHVETLQWLGYGHIKGSLIHPTTLIDFLGIQSSNLQLKKFVTKLKVKY